MIDLRSKLLLSWTLVLGSCRGVCIDFSKLIFINGRAQSAHCCPWAQAFIVMILQVLKAEALKEPLILFIRNIEKSIIGNFDRYLKLESLKDARVVVIGSHTTEQLKEKVHT
jgi:hypothetical protein